MNGGIGKRSYACNSSIQRTVISMVKPILEESVVELYCSMLPECFKMADLGCSAGPNTLLVVSEVIDIIIDAIHQRLKFVPPPFIQAFLNDLHGNDFNTVFESLPSFYKKLEKEKKGMFKQCFIAGAPGSFYGRLFPNNSLHFFHSSYSLMWISKAPSELINKEGEALNKGNIYTAKTSPPIVTKAYFEQFKKDFMLFLKSRAEEMIHGGHMVITTMGSIKSDDPLSIWEFVGLKLNEMASEGLIDESKLDSFNLPYYAATKEEVRELIEEEGSFAIKRLEAFNMDWDAYLRISDGSLGKQERAIKLATDIRAVGEPILASQFGESVMDDLFRRFKDDVLDYMEAHNCQFVNLVMSLAKKNKTFTSML